MFHLTNSNRFVSLVQRIPSEYILLVVALNTYIKIHSKESFKAKLSLVFLQLLLLLKNKGEEPHTEMTQTLPILEEISDS